MNIKRILAFFGPAYLISIGYMDPGNWATDIMGGSRYGYALLWVLLASNIAAILLQSLCARLGLVTGKDLAQANRAIYPRKINYALYGLAELAIIATDLAEVLGMALGLNLLLGLPMLWGVLLTVLDTFLFLMLIRFGFRIFQAFIISLIAVIGGGLFIIVFMADPEPVKVLGGLIPSIPDKSSLYIIAGIIGATVMPHNLYLHSSIVKATIKDTVKSTIKRAIFWSTVDSTIALNLAFFVNGAILVIAATIFYTAGYYNIEDIRDAHALLEPLLGNSLAPNLFAIALIAAGQSSTITGTLAGQVVMDGYLKLKIKPVYRRLFTRMCAIIPAVTVIVLAGDNKISELLIFSQVFLSLQLGFAILPLLIVVHNKKIMDDFAISHTFAILMWVLTLVLVYLNVNMVIEEVTKILSYMNSVFFSTFIFVILSFIVWLFLYSVYYPIKHRKSPTLIKAVKRQ